MVIPPSQFELHIFEEETRQEIRMADVYHALLPWGEIPAKVSKDDTAYREYCFGFKQKEYVDFGTHNFEQFVIETIQTVVYFYYITDICLHTTKICGKLYHS